MHVLLQVADYEADFILISTHSCTGPNAGVGDRFTSCVTGGLPQTEQGADCVSTDE